MTLNDRVVVVTDLPGVSADNIWMALRGQTHQIVADQSTAITRSEVSLPQRHMVPMRRLSRHGILEIMLGTKPDHELAREALNH